MKIISFTALLIFLCCLISSAVFAFPPLQYDGDTVFIDDANLYLGATPHTVIGIQPVIIEFETKQYSGNINFGFGYNGEYLKPFRLERWNPHEVCNTDGNNTQFCYTENWTRVTNNNNEWNHIKRNINGKTDWYYRTDIPIIANQNYKLRVWVEAPYLTLGQTQEEQYPNYDGKYDVIIFRSVDTLQEAYDNNRLYLLDPDVELTTGLVSYYSFDTDATDDHGSYDLTNSGATQGTTGCILGGCYDFTADYMTSTYTTIPDAFSYSFWVHADSSGSDQFFLSTAQASNGAVQLLYLADTTLLLAIFSGSTWANTVSSAVDLTDGLHHLVFTYDGTNTKIYMDNTEIGSGTSGLPSGTYKGSGERTYMAGWNPTHPATLNGYFDELGVWDKALNTDEVTALYNSGVGFAYPFIENPVSPPFNITAKNTFNGSNLNVFNATIDGTTYYTTNGTLNTPLLHNSTELHNFTIVAPDHFSVTESLYNISANGNYNAMMFQTELKINCYEIITNNSLTCNENKFNYNAGNHSFIVNVTDYYSKSATIELFALENKSLNVYLANALINITAYNDVTNTSVEAFSINTVNNLYSYDITNSTIGQLFQVYLIEGLNYSFTFSKGGFVSEQFDYNNITNQNIQLNVSSVNINVAFFDELTELSVKNVSFKLFYENGNATFGNTTTGITTLELNNTGLLEIEYNAEGYSLRKFYITITETTSETINLYLLSDSVSSEINYFLTDENGIALSGATLKVLRRYINDETTTYKIVTMSKSDNAGEGSVFLQQNEATYQFLIEYNGNIVLTTAPTTIFSTTKTLSATLSDNVIQSSIINVNLSQSLTFNNDTNTFTYVWSDPNNLIREMCFYVEKITSGGAIAINSSCVSSSSGIIVLGIGGENATGNFIGRVTSDTNTAYTKHTTAYLEVMINNLAKDLGVQGLWWFAILALAVGLTFLFVGGTIAGIIGLIVAIIAGGLFGLISLGWGMSMFLISMAIIFIVGLAKRSFL